MNIDITARNFHISDDLKELIENKVTKLLQYDNNIFLSEIILLKESRAEKIELIIHSKQHKYFTKCYSSLFEKTLAKAIKNIIQQIKKAKTKY